MARLTRVSDVLYHARPVGNWRVTPVRRRPRGSGGRKLSRRDSTRAYHGVEPETPTERLARQQRNLLLSFAGMGLELAGGIVGFVLLGYLIDWKFGTSPVWLVIGATVGCIGGLYNTIRRAIEMQRRMEALSRRAADDAAEPDASESRRAPDGKKDVDDRS